MSESLKDRLLRRIEYLKHFNGVMGQHFYADELNPLLLVMMDCVESLDELSHKITAWNGDLRVMHRVDKALAAVEALLGEE